MVFCYKILTSSPGRTSSPSPAGYHDGSVGERHRAADIVDVLPEREWRLLVALARKRDELDERDKLAEALQCMWMKEKEERETVRAETSAQYKCYLDEKRRQEQCFQEYKKNERAAELQARRGQLLDCIWYKEHRSANLLASREERKLAATIDKVIDDEMRTQLAAERRLRLGAAEEWKKRVKLEHGMRRANDASIKRSTRLKDTSQRLAITRALNDWETALIRQDVEVERSAGRRLCAARAAQAEARGARAAAARAARSSRARALADHSAQMRELIKGTK